MSTSPSWFDQEKFSRLVKKVGPKAGAAGPLPATATRSAAAPRSPEKETKRLQRRALSTEDASSAAENASPKSSTQSLSPRIVGPSGVDTPIRATPQEPGTENISSNFPAPLPVPEPRSVSPLARRTTSLPNLKPIFEYEKPAGRFGAEAAPETSEEQETDEASAPEQPVWPGMASPSEDEEAEGDQKSEEIDQLIEQRDQLLARLNDLSKITEERDDARREVSLLRNQLQQADEIMQASSISGSGHEEILRLIEERDNARRDYASLREQFETLKKEPGRSASGFSAKSPGEEEGDREEKTHGLEEAVARLKEELDSMQAQVTQYRDEASVAQRGLALSQKALQETRDALRETSEGFSLTRANVENLKNECSTLSQQNMVLQAQHDQVARELAAAKAKLGSQG